MAAVNWRTINVDLYDPDSAANFDTTTLLPATSIPPASLQEIQRVATQVRQLLRGGDTEGAFRSALDMVPYGADVAVKDAHTSTVLEVLHGIKANDITAMLTKIFQEANGPETLDTLMKYLYKGMAQAHAKPSAAAVGTSSSSDRSSRVPQYQSPVSHSSRSVNDTGGQAMSVLLSWHERLVEVVGLGSIVRVMSDRRIV